VDFEDLDRMAILSSASRQSAVLPSVKVLFCGCGRFGPIVAGNIILRPIFERNGDITADFCGLNGAPIGP
jgi:hypothetical protein